MNGLEVMGVFLLVSIASVILYIFIWLVGSVWRNNRDMNEILTRIRMLENALLTSNPPSKTKRKIK